MSGSTMAWAADRECPRPVPKIQLDGAARISGRNGFFYLDAQLNRRQKDIVRLLAQGVPQVEIARQLGLSQGIVKNQIRSVIDKLKLWNTKALVTWARLYPEYLA